MKMKFKYFIPLISFMIPTIVISTILFVIDAPPPPVQLGGFIVLLIAVCGTYYLGLKKVFDDITAG